MFARHSLAERSVDIIRLNQHESGSYTACPLYAHYAYCWLRDGTFIANAMDVAKRHDSSLAFYRWAARVVDSRADQIKELIRRKNNGEYINQGDYLNTRYHFHGAEDYSEWGNFQLDGYGAWLWGLAEHILMTGRIELAEQLRPAIDSTVDYLLAFWTLPNFDCWEEFNDRVHPSTLACLYAGLDAIGKLTGRSDCQSACVQIKRLLTTYAVGDRRTFVKNVIPSGDGGWTISDDRVDASLLWLLEPFKLFGPEDEAMRLTVERIGEELLTPGGGLRRYVGDAYYGGGEWILLTAWYGLARLSSGDREEAERCLRWIGEQADPLGRLPEQVAGSRTDRGQAAEWEHKLGKPALPLLWSHAMYLVLHHRLLAE